MSPDYITALGLAAAACTTVSYIPQVIQTFRSRQTQDISLLMYVILTAGILLWLVYGILLNNVPLIAANAVSLSLALSVLILKIRHG